MPFRGRPLVELKTKAAGPARSLLRDALVHGDLGETQFGVDTEFRRFVASTFAQAADDRLMRSLLARHGVFAERFFTQRVRERVARRFALRVSDLEECRERARAGQPSWRYAVREDGGASEMVRLVVSLLFEQTALRALETTDTLSVLHGWCARHEAPRRCMLVRRGVLPYGPARLGLLRSQRLQGVLPALPDPGAARAVPPGGDHPRVRIRLRLRPDGGMRRRSATPSPRGSRTEAGPA